MNKTELIEAIASKTGQTKTNANDMLNAFMDTVSEALKKGDDIRLVGFGTFSVQQTKARTGRNPQTGKPIDIPAKGRVKFKAGADLAGAVN